MTIKRIDITSFEQVKDVFYSCFKNDLYYDELFGSVLNEQELMNLGLAHCLELGHCLGAFHQDILTGYILCFDYKNMMDNNPKEFCDIFGAQNLNSLPYFNELHQPILKLNNNTLFILSVAVLPSFRNQGIASNLLDHIMALFPDHNFVGDVSNAASLKMYEKRNYCIHEIASDYYLVVHTAP